MITIAFIGRSNVGKSSIFNRIVGEAKALVSDIAHTTRDRVSGTTMWRGTTIRCIDTGGVEEIERSARNEKQRTVEEEIRAQVQRAIRDADALVLVIDARDGVLPGERAIAREIRMYRKPIIVAWNKAETARLRAGIDDAAAIGLGAAIPTSAATGMGIGDLLDRIVELAPPEPDAQPEADTAAHDAPPLRVALVGEPNVGKSSLINAILGREEVIVHPEPFTTRDVHDVDATIDGQRVTLLDTAGIRRLAVRATRGVKTKIEAIERLAVVRSLRAIERADVVCFVLDGFRPATRHVKQLAEKILRSGRACVVLVNKMDLLPGRPDSELLSTHIQRQFSYLDWALVLPVSATTGAGVRAIVPTAVRAGSAWRRQLTGEQLAAIHGLVKRRIPTARTAFGRKRSHIVEIQQLDVAPPTFLIMSRRRVRIPKAIPAIVERAVRDSVDFAGSPIRITVKSVK